MLFNITNTERQRDQILDHLKQKQYKRVIDIGAAWNPWTKEVCTHLTDIVETQIPGIHSFLGDINEPEVWDDIKADVAKNGKFDYAICTHVLEDIRNPVTVLKAMPLIAKEGFIAMPNKHWELSKGVECVPEKEHGEWGVTDNWIGFFHHRWIYDVKKDNKLWIFPKLEFVGKLIGYDWVIGRDACDELSFCWKDDIPWQIVNNDFLGPNGVAVCNQYRELLTE